MKVVVQKCGIADSGDGIDGLGKVRFENLPHLNDVTTMLQLLGRMELRFYLMMQFGRTRRIAIEFSCRPYDLVRTMRQVSSF